MTKEELTIQSPENIRLQKYRSSLMASGGAMIIFSLWTLLRSFVQIEAKLNYRGDTEALKPWITAILIVGIVELVLMIYLGISARGEGMGKKKRRPYLVLGIIVAALSAVSILYLIFDFQVECQVYGVIGAIVTLAVEITFFYAALDLVVSAIRVRKLEEETGRA